MTSNITITILYLPWPKITNIIRNLSFWWIYNIWQTFDRMRKFHIEKNRAKNTTYCTCSEQRKTSFIDFIWEQGSLFDGIRNRPNQAKVLSEVYHANFAQSVINSWPHIFVQNLVGKTCSHLCFELLSCCNENETHGMQVSIFECFSWNTTWALLSRGENNIAVNMSKLKRSCSVH